MDAVQLIRQAIRIDPACVAYHSNLGAAYQKSNRLQDAERAFREAVRLAPEFADALSNLGSALYELHRPAEALPYLERALALEPSHASARMNMAMALHSLERSGEAIPHARTAAELAGSEEAILKYGGLLIESNRPLEGISFFQAIIERDASNVAAHQALADCYMSAGMQREAAPHYWKVLQLKPESSSAANNMGICLAEAGYRADALPFYRKALEISPNEAPIWANLGLALKELGQPEEGLECEDRAIAIRPAYPKAIFNRSLCLLALGRLAEAWEGYAWRFQAQPKNPPRIFPHPVWDGSDPAGKTLLVWMEQGLGDQILFSGLLPDLLRAGAHCIVECDYRLTNLISRSFSGVEAIPQLNPPHPYTERPDIDFQIAAGSLPRWFRPKLESFPQHRGYLSPDPELSRKWRERIGGLGAGLKVGICWRSGLNKEARSVFYARLNQWGPILSIPGIEFINLQYDECNAELQEAEQLFGIQVHRWGDVDLKQDQESVAALISNLDLVISAGTAVDQLAGALGVRAWVLLRANSDTWGLGTGGCPWYPSVRPFYCEVLAEWEPVIGRMASELRKLPAGGDEPSETARGTE
ncbi:MAG: tetratricopeptide repeat protein [Acidobacteriia bacterium]|nr:tetratricopeptide repeat protein [Terriglobia bacterium]